MDLYDLMADLGIIDAPKKGEGKPVSTKRISRDLIEQSIKAILRAELYKSRKPGPKGKLEAMPPSQLYKLSQDRVIRLYM